MTNTHDLQSLIGGTAVDTDGTKIGKIGQVYLDDATGQPVWVTVHTGMFGGRESFAPVHGSQTIDGGQLQLAVSKAMVKDAPSVDADGHLEDDENDVLYDYYQGHLGQAGNTDGTDGTGGHDRDDVVATAGRHEGEHEVEHVGDSREDLAGRAGVVGRDTSGPTTDDAMTRSEERLHVGTRDGGGRPRPPAQVRRHRARHHHRARCRTRRSASSASRSPRTTRRRPDRPRPVARRSTRSPCTPSVPSWQRRPSRSSGSGSAPRPSPSRPR